MIHVTPIPDPLILPFPSTATRSKNRGQIRQQTTEFHSIRKLALVLTLDNFRCYTGEILLYGYVFGNVATGNFTHSRGQIHPVMGDHHSVETLFFIVSRRGDIPLRTITTQIQASYPNGMYPVFAPVTSRG